MSDGAPGLKLRQEALADDSAAVARLVADTGFFSPAEVDIAVELVEDRLKLGERSDYEFVFAETDRLVGYACWGDIPGTVGSVDLYWIVVDQSEQGRGIGRVLLSHAEQRAAKRGALRMFVDTSGRSQYAPTVAFYRRCGYDEVARIGDFYASGDPKVVLRRDLGSPGLTPAKERMQ